MTDDPRDIAMILLLLVLFYCNSNAKLTPNSHPKLRAQSVKAKHKLVAQDEDQRQVHLCDVMSWTDSEDVRHGVSGMLEVTRRFTPSTEIRHMPRFRLTLARPPDPQRPDKPQLVSFFEKLRRSRQAAVIVLNKRGWVGYLVPHERERKFYCHFHYQQRMDSAARQPLRLQPAKMAKLEVISDGPWSAGNRSNRNWDIGCGLAGPDYDPALVYSVEELDPYRDMPPLPQSEGSVIPLLEFDEADEEGASMDAYSNHGVYQAMGRNESVGGDVGETRAGQRQGENRSAQAQAAAKYGEELRTESQQASSFIYHLKRFNNWVKATLIAKASKDPGRTGLRVLDLACGKGGDLGKWAAHPDGVELYVGSDIAFGSLEHLIERMAKSAEKGGRGKWHNIPVKLFEADLGENDVQRDHLQVWDNSGGRAGEWERRIPLNAGDLFDVVSMQFALHYMGQTEGRMRHFLHEVSRRLRVGGIFVATTMDSRVLMQLLMGHAEKTWDVSRERTTLRVDIEDERRHNLLSIMFRDPHESYLRQHSEASDTCGPFGLEYTFTLRETELNKNAVDEVPEWMLPLDALKDAASDHGLELVTAQNFHEFYAHESQEDPARQHLRNMHVFNPQGSMNKTEWRIAGIYMALVFRKSSKQIQPVTAASSTPPSPRQPPPEQHLPTSPKSPPPSWEGGAPKYQPASPDHPPPGWPTASADGDDNAGSFDSVYTPQSPASSPPTDGGYVPQSPTAPPPDIDSDEDENYDRALAEARSAVPPDVWEAYSPDEKKSCIDERMKMLEAAQGSPRL